MKTYKIEQSNEPIEAGCLTQFGVYLVDLIDSNYFNIDEVKHLKCYEINHFTYPVRGRTCRKIEITDPSELQRIWEAIRGEEPEKIFDEYTRKKYPSAYKQDREYWQNFTLEPGTYQVDNANSRKKRTQNY